MEKMNETITVIPDGGVDPDGYPLPDGGQFSAAALVEPLTESEFIETDAVGITTKLRLFVSPTIEINESDRVIVRGEHYRVAQIPFDWSAHRRPVLRRHQPLKTVVVERGEG